MNKLSSFLNKINNKIAHEKRAIKNVKLLPKFKQLSPPNPEKIAVINFSSRRLERHYYFICKFLSLSGYRIYIINNRGWLGSIDKFKFDFFKIKNIFRIDSASIESDLYFYDEICNKGKVKSKKEVFVCIDIFHYSRDQSNTVFMPLPLSADQYTILDDISLDRLRKKSRTIRLFFSGNLHRASYDGSEIKEIYKKLSRVNIIDYLKAKLTTEEIEIRQVVGDDDSVSGKFILNDWFWRPDESRLNGRINNSNWLEYLGKSDFFLCCPGIVMPPTHAVAEALSVGSIPVIEFPEFYPPGLEHMVNCIIFSGKADLLEKVRMVLNFDLEQISRMRAEVIKYYDSNLTPQAYIKSIEQVDSKNINYIIYTSYSHLN